MPRKLQVVTFFWMLLAVGGMAGLVLYSKTPGETGQVPSQRLVPEDGRGKVMVFLHPRCPCSHATVRQLARLTPKQRRDWDIELYLFQPNSESDADWTSESQSRSLDQLKQIATRIEDTDGAIAASYGAHTSGHVVAYASDGRLRFSGGITVGRGHEGDNAAFTTLRKILTSEEPRDAEFFPVFGCRLQGAGA